MLSPSDCFLHNVEITFAGWDHRWQHCWNEACRRWLSQELWVRQPGVGQVRSAGTIERTNCRFRRPWNEVRRKFRASLQSEFALFSPNLVFCEGHLRPNIQLKSFFNRFISQSNQIEILDLKTNFTVKISCRFYQSMDMSALLPVYQGISSKNSGWTAILYCLGSLS